MNIEKLTTRIDADPKLPKLTILHVLIEVDGRNYDLTQTFTRNKFAVQVASAIEKAKPQSVNDLAPVFQRQYEELKDKYECAHCHKYFHIDELDEDNHCTDCYDKLGKCANDAPLLAGCGLEWLEGEPT